MTCEWNDDRLWAMHCDESGCTTTSEAFPTRPDLDLFQERGWFVADLFGDICPACLAKGVTPKVAAYREGGEPK